MNVPTATGPAARRAELLTLDIDSLAYGGRGVARSNGYVVFVAGALPGDQVRAEVTKAKRQFAEAQAVELLRPSPDRVPDRCRHADEACPGAPWQGLDYERQLIMMTLEHTRDNKTRAAEILGISLKTLHNKLNKLRLRPKKE